MPNSPAGSGKFRPISSITAEGVETADQQLFLRAAGVHSMQGYRFGKAVTAAEITTRLQLPSLNASEDKIAFVG